MCFLTYTRFRLSSFEQLNKGTLDNLGCEDIIQSKYIKRAFENSKVQLDIKSFNLKSHFF